MNQQNNFQQFGTIEQHADKFDRSLTDISNAVNALRAETQALQHLYDQSVIHHLQLQDDIEALRNMYHRMKAQMNKFPASLETANEIYTTCKQENKMPDQPKKIKLEWSVEPEEPYRHTIQNVFCLDTGSVVCSVCFNRNGDCIAFSNNKAIFVVSTQDGSLINKFDIPNVTNNFNSRAIRISPDSQYLAFGGPENNLLIYSIPSRRMLASLKEHENNISSLLFSEDSSILYSGGFDGYLCIWQLKTLKLSHKVVPRRDEMGAGNANGRDMIVALTKDEEESFIAVGFMNGYVSIYYPYKEGSEFKYWSTFKAHEQYLLDVAISPHNSYLATSSHDKTVKIWYLGGIVSMKHELKGHTDFVLSTCFSPKEEICFSGSKDETIKAWDYNKGKLLFSLKAHNNTLFELAHHPTEKFFVSCSGDGHVCLWKY